MEFSVSVIIPVYNGENFIEKAIVSILQQTDVFEVIVVVDGCTDDTVNIIKNLQKKYSNIKTYYHENKINKGRSASRNLGIKKATGNFIAFLDADDFYLPNRFVSDKKIFNKYINVDGVYNAIGAHYYRESSKSEKDRLKLTTVKEKIYSKDLFEALLIGKNGHFSIDGLTVKRSVFDRVGFFNENFKVSEDTEIIWRMALKCQLVAGLIDRPVAMRGVHEANVFNQEDLYKGYRIKLLESLVFWSSKKKIPLKQIDLILNGLWILKFKEGEGLIKNIKYWLYLFVNNSRILFSHLSIKYFPVVRLRQKLFPFLFP